MTDVRICYRKVNIQNLLRSVSWKEKRVKILITGGAGFSARATKETPCKSH
jgi:hypothetical protein